MELAKVYRANVFTFRLLALFLSRELWELHGLVCHYLLSLLSIVQVTWRQSTRLLGEPLKPKKTIISCFSVRIPSWSSSRPFATAAASTRTSDLRWSIAQPASEDREPSVSSIRVSFSWVIFSCSVHVEPILIQARLSVCQQWSTSLWDLT